VRWVLVWVVLVLGAALVLFLLGRRLWRQARELTVELGTATDRLTALTDRLAELENAPVAGVEQPDGVRSQGPRRRP
jgi:uncharacterized protein HemX